MKFACGKTTDEKREAAIRRDFVWHLKFAWLPIKLGKHDCRWLEYVERCKVKLNLRGDEWDVPGLIILSTECDVDPKFMGDWEYAPRGTHLPYFPPTGTGPR